jgi:hypothetical protein
MPLKPNLKLMGDHGSNGSFEKWKKDNEVPSGNAFCLHFEKGKKIFNYIGARHTVDPKSHTFKLIKKIIDKYKPDLVITEGVHSDEGINFKVDLKSYGGEGSYAIKVSRKYNSDYAGIEGRESKFFAELAKIFKIEDLYGFLFMQAYKYNCHTRKLTKQEFFSRFKQIKDHIDRDFGKLALDEFDPLKWFHQTFKKYFRYGLYLEYASPSNKKNAVITQKISYAHSVLRDTSNIKTLYKYLNAYDNVLFIMGMNHTNVDRPVLVDTFGDYTVIY